MESTESLKKLGMIELELSDTRVLLAASECRVANLEKYIVRIEGGNKYPLTGQQPAATIMKSTDEASIIQLDLSAQLKNVMERNCEMAKQMETLTVKLRETVEISKQRETQKMELQGRVMELAKQLMNVGGQLRLAQSKESTLSSAIEILKNSLSSLATEFNNRINEKVMYRHITIPLTVYIVII